MSESGSSEEIELDGHDGLSPPTDESSPRESAIYEESQRGSEKEEQSQADSEGDDRPQDQSAAATKRKPGAAYKRKLLATKRKEEGLEDQSRRNYEVLLNSLIEDTNHDNHGKFEALAPSHVGESLWTSYEKEALFTALPVYGRDDLPRISKAVGTKSIPEVRSFLLLVERDRWTHDPSKVSLPSDDHAEIPAAYEIGDYCNGVLSSTAEVLARLDYEEESRSERDTYGSRWLIDEDVAADIEEGFEQREAEARADMSPVAEASNGSTHISEVELEDRDEDDQDGDPINRPAGPKQATEKLHRILASGGLLRSDVLIQLSRNVFMNSSSASSDSWQNMETIDGNIPGPAMFFSAFQDLHNIVIDATRRMLQATLFQTMSRLRAKDESQPIAIVTENDVMVACDLIGMTPEWRKYWATAPRRCGVSVCSESNRFDDGREGSRIGYPLTFDEAEVELGFERVSQPAAARHGSYGSEEVESISDDEERDSDRDLQEDDQSPIASSPGGDEEEYLEMVDRDASRKEEEELLNLMNVEAPSLDSEPEADLEGRKKRRIVEDAIYPDWRKKTRYAGEWEQHHMGIGK